MSKTTGRPYVSSMKESDISFAVRMTDAERWGYLASDFENLLAFEPGGCFVARVDQEPVGIVTSTSYDNYAFVGTLIVEPSRRKVGIGECLLKHAMAYLESKGVRTIELDGVFKAASLYRRLGFRDKYLSLRFLRPPTHPPTAGKPLIPDPTEEIVEFDRERTGIARRRILRRYLEQYKDRVFVTRNPELCAYAFVRPRSDGAVSVGPLVSADNRSAQRLLSGIAVKYARQHVSIGVPEAQRSMVTHLVDLGFRYLAPSLRMYRGEKKHYESHIYGILSPEKG